MRDARPPATKQVLCDQFAHGEVVHAYETAFELLNLAVRHDEWQRPLPDSLEDTQSILPLAGRDNQALDLARHQRLDFPHFPLRLLAADRKNCLVPGPVQNIADALQHFAEEGIYDARDYDTNQMATLKAKGTPSRVGHVPNLSRALRNPLACGLADIVMAGEGFGNSHLRDSEVTSDVGHRHRAPDWIRPHGKQFSRRVSRRQC
jgi:hypothetical protein